jgi:hypothetical protein
MKLDEDDLSARTRGLDTWLRELCWNYPVMSSKAREVLRNFLKIVGSGLENDGKSYPNFIYMYVVFHFIFAILKEKSSLFFIFSIALYYITLITFSISCYSLF